MGVEVIHLTFPPHVFSDLIKFGTCYIMGQWGQVQKEIKDVSIFFQKLFLLFFIIIYVFIMMYILNLAYFMRRKCQLDCMDMNTSWDQKIAYQ